MFVFSLISLTLFYTLEIFSQNLEFGIVYIGLRVKRLFLVQC